MSTEPAAPSTKSGRWRRVLGWLAALASLFLLARFFFGGERSASEVLGLIRLEILAVGVLVYLGFMGLRAWRLSVLLGAHAPPLGALYAIQATSGALGALSPGRIAEATKIELLRRDHGVPVDRALMAFGVEKTQDLGFYGVATLLTVWIVGNLEFIPEGWVKDAFLPLMALFVAIAFGLLVFDLRRRELALRDLVKILFASALVFGGTFLLCYVVFVFHGVPDPWTTLAVNSLTVMAGALSGLPGGGQGVVQYAFDFSAQKLFAIAPDVAYSMVLHITLNFYTGVMASVMVGALIGRKRSL